MGKDQDISSTQRLLQHVSGRSRSAQEMPSPASAHRRSWFSGLDSLWGRKRAIVGAGPALAIEVSGSRLNLVKMVPSAGHWRADETASVLLDASQLPGTPEFVRVLRAQLARFSALSNCSVWILLPGSRGDIWHIRVPKVKKGMAAVVQQVARADRPFDAATTLFDYRITGDVTDGGVQKHRVECYSVNRKDLKVLTDAVAAAGLVVTGVTLTAYAVRNFFESRWPGVGQPSLVALHIDHEHSYVNLFSGSLLVSSRVIRTGLSSFVQAIEAGVKDLQRKPQGVGPSGLESIEFPGADAGSPPAGRNEALGSAADRSQAAADVRYPGSFSPAELEAFFEQLEVEEDAQAVRQASGRSLPSEQIFAWVQPVLARLLRQAELTVDHALSELNFSPPSEVLVSGYGATAPRFLAFLQEQLNIPVKVLDPLGVQARENSSQVNSLSLLARSRLALATGAAISQNEYTPNFLFTAADREREAQADQVGRLVTGGGVALLLGVSVLSWFAHREAVELRNLLAYEQTILESMMRKGDAAELVQRSEALQARVEGLRRDARRYEGVGLIGELVGLTPTEISLLNVRLEWPAQDRRSDARAAPAIVIEGFVGGAEDRFDTRLSSYLFQLQTSPLFAAPSIRNSEVERFGREGRVLRFMIHLPSVGI